jgi:hypothetical protein
MFNFLSKARRNNTINSVKQVVRAKAIEIAEKMSKLTDHLDIIKNMYTEDAKEIYDKEKNILISLYDYYCKFQKLYSDLNFSEILNPIDKSTIKNMDIKNFVNQIKILNKKDYEITIECLNDGDKCYIKNIFEQLEKDIDDLVNMLINIQSDIIIQEILPIEQEMMLEKIKNIIDQNSVIHNFKIIENNYLKYLDEYNAAKEIFK